MGARNTLTLLESYLSLDLVLIEEPEDADLVRCQRRLRLRVVRCFGSIRFFTSSNLRLKLFQVEISHEGVAKSDQVVLRLLQLRLLDFPSLSILSTENRRGLMHEKALLIDRLELENRLFGLLRYLHR